MSDGHLVLAYHGCDASTRDGLVNASIKQLNPSNNRYDWLGQGVYFFENDPQRALDFAISSFKHPQKKYTAQPITKPAVVGAVLQINQWLDMTTQFGIQVFATAYTAYVNNCNATGKPIAKNKPADQSDVDVILHHLDKAVFDILHAAQEDQKLTPYDAVRGAFLQGKEVAPSSAFKAKTHVQIALRNPHCVKGWFLVPGFH